MEEASFSASLWPAIPLITALSVCDRLVDSRRADYLTIINDRDLFSNICTGGISKSLRTLVSQSQLYDPFFVLHAVRLNTCLCRSNLRTIQYNGSVGQLELQGTGFTQLFQDRVGIGYTGDLDVDTVGTFLVNLSLCAVAVYTLLQLINRVFHLLLCRCSHHRLPDR